MDWNRLLTSTSFATMLFASSSLAETQVPAQFITPEPGPGDSYIQRVEPAPPTTTVPDLTGAFLNAQLQHGTLLNMYDVLGDFGHPHYVTAGQNLWRIAGQYQHAIGAPNQAEAMARIIAHNGLQISTGANGNDDFHINSGQRLFIPLAHGVEIHAYRVAAPTPLLELADTLQQQGRLAPAFNNAGAISAATIIAQINNLDDIGATIEGTVNIPAADDFINIAPLTAPPPGWGTRATLAVAEWNGDHHRTVFEYATDMAAAVNPAYDRRNIVSIMTPSHLSPDFNLGLDHIDELGSSTNEQLIFSRSVYIRHNQESPPEEYRQSQTRETQNARINDTHYYLDTPHTFFISAGNDRETLYELADGTQSALNKDVLVTVEDSMAGRAYVIGAAHTASNNQTPLVARYSSIGADFIGPPLPLNDGEAIYGTSFSTPMVAALYRQMAEWYGGVLTPEEIMAAASMTTDMSIQNFDPVVTGDNMARLTEYHTNGGGRPYHDRAGAGMIDPQRWNEALQQMAVMKLEQGLESRFHNETFYLSTYSHIQRQNPETGQDEYIYNVPLPADMTLDRLSFILPQEENTRADTTITSPSGFSIKMPLTYTETMATSAFALEDVRAGDVLQIRTGQPFRPNALVQIRGHYGNNVVQQMRDHLIETGAMPQPNSHYSGNQLVPAEPPRPEPGYIERVFDSLRF